MNSRILVWDLPTRIFHWCLVVSFAVAFLTAESERWRGIHVLSGYAVLYLMAFRLLWGFAGSRYARFAEFVRGPQTILRYLNGMVGGRPEHYVGHNPLGAVAILALIVLGIGSSLTGWLVYDELGGEWMEELHESISNGMLVAVVVHVLGVMASSKLHHQNLVLAMVTGKKPGEAKDAIPRPRALVAIFLVAGLVALCAWTLGRQEAINQPVGISDHESEQTNAWKWDDD